VAFVTWDSVTNGVTSWVQRIAWVLVTVYTGPVGLFFYLLACRRPFPGGHDEYTNVPWKQALNSEMHCVAGDATGIIIAAAIVPSLGLANGWDVSIEYLAGFACGLFIFQALMMRAMYGGDYVMAVRKTFFAETVSMNVVMTGMIPTMILIAHAWPASEDPLSGAFWFRMSIATMVGALLAFPVNSWLVANRLKHGCMTLPGADEPAPHLGHRSLEANSEMAMAGMAMPANEMSGDADARAADTTMAGRTEMPEGRDVTSGTESAAMEMPGLPLRRALTWIGATYAILLAAILLTSLVAPLRF
jgi:hypothetical protein